jgi:diguanylate cyclase (GGDEF)-like protein
VYAALSAAAIALYYVLPRAGVAQAVVLDLVNATAAVVILRTALRTRGTARVVWVALFCAISLELLANIPYYAIPLLTGGRAPFPSPIDGLFLLTYPCFVTAFLALARHRRRTERRGDAIDAALLTLAGGTLLWVFVIAPVVQEPEPSLLTHIVSVAYPSMDVAVLAVFVRLMVSGLHRSGASRLLLGAILALLGGDIVASSGELTGTYAIGGVADGLWMAFYSLTAVAALHPTASAFPRTLAPRGFAVTKARLAFLGLSLLVGPLLLAFRQGEPVVLRAITLSAFLLVTVRLTGLNWRLESVTLELERQAGMDGLTGLRNRSALSAALDAALTVRGHDDGVALLLVDLDDFKQVNDLAGHTAGDAILVEAAERMRSVVRPRDVVARLGGDEFAVLLAGTDGEALGQRLIDTFRTPFTHGGRSFTLGASVGVVAAGADVLPERLVQEADIAMYAAKRAGKNRVVLFEESMYADIVEGSDLALALRGAVERGEMRLEYQPIVRLRDHAIVGVEALARWRHPQYGEVPPGRFIPIAEESGVIGPLGRWLLRTALGEVAGLHGLSGVPLTLNVNVSAVQLADPCFSAEVAAALGTSRMAGHRLVLEITEGALVGQESEAGRQLHALRALGVHVSIDDFGTGSSSLAYLQQLPVAEVKIDRSFIAGIDRDGTDAAVARAILRMCEELGLRCIAEGVERPTQVALLEEVGCEYAQGFHLGRPASIAAVAELLDRRPAGAPARRRLPLPARAISTRPSAEATA